jgi:hypothetical protein
VYMMVRHMSNSCQAITLTGLGKIGSGSYRVHYWGQLTRFRIVDSNCWKHDIHFNPRDKFGVIANKTNNTVTWYDSEETAIAAVTLLIQDDIKTGHSQWS